MRLYDDDDDYGNEERGSGSGINFVYMALIMSIVILAVTALVFWANGAHRKSDGRGYAEAVAQREERLQQSGAAAQNESEDLQSKDKLTANQLDIWTLPDTGRRDDNSSKSGSGNGTVTNQTTGETVSGDDSEGSKEKETTATADELASGKTSVYDMAERESEVETKEEEDDDDEDEEITSIRVSHADGTKEWVDIDENLERNTYDYDNLKLDKSVMRYYENGKAASWLGVDISSNNGEVDFDKLKKAKCDFCMLRVGARGYSSGNIVMDKSFEDNLKGARSAKLDIGVYFCSQAVTKAEAREEADVLLDAIDGYDISYPVVFVMENIKDDMARIEALDTKDRTQIAVAFLDEIADAGYTPMIYGDLEWLLTMLDLEALEEYDVWIAENGSKPQYPYKFGIWQYDSEGSISGISGDAALSISFVDYAK